MIGKLWKNVPNSIPSRFCFHQIRAGFIPDIFGRPGELCFVPKWPDPQWTEYTPSIKFTLCLINSPPCHLSGKTGDWQESGLVLSPMQRSKLILPERQGPATLKAAAASRTANHHYLLERPSETLSIKEPVSNPRILSGLCCTHRDTAVLVVSRSCWHGFEMTLITAATTKKSPQLPLGMQAARQRQHLTNNYCAHLSSPGATASAPLPFPPPPPHPFPSFLDALNCFGFQTASYAG